jgi:predicted enzyme related to lactoylglutathione lyase
MGGIFTKPPQTPAPFWLYYFNVDAIDAAAERVKAKGGRIVNGPMEVPNGQWIVQGLDPQDAMFALLAPKR